MELAFVVDVAVKALVVGLSLFPIMRPESAHFAGKAMGARAVLYPAAMVLVPMVWLVAGRPVPCPFGADIALGIPFLVDAAGNVFGLFSIQGFDAITHLKAGPSRRSRSVSPSARSRDPGSRSVSCSASGLSSTSSGRSVSTC